MFEESCPATLYSKCVESEALSLRRADSRWFEHTAPSGILAPNTEAIDGFYSGLDPDQFVGPDNAAYLEGKPDEGFYYKLSAAGTVSSWAQDFADNKCELLPICMLNMYTDTKTWRRWFTVYSPTGQRR